MTAKMGAPPETTDPAITPHVSSQAKPISCWMEETEAQEHEHLTISTDDAHTAAHDKHEDEYIEDVTPGNFSVLQEDNELIKETHTATDDNHDDEHSEDIPPGSTQAKYKDNANDVIPESPRKISVQSTSSQALLWNKNTAREGDHKSTTHDGRSANASRIFPSLTAPSMVPIKRLYDSSSKETQGPTVPPQIGKNYPGESHTLINQFK
jgi:hypothetical protein